MTSSLQPVFYRCEGYVDELILETVGIVPRLVIRTSGNGGIVNAMTKMPQAIVVAITDDDKQKPEHFKKFHEVKFSTSLCYKRQIGTRHHLIFLIPAVEQWILDCAQSVGVEPNKYGVPNTLEGLKKITKRDTIKNNQEFRRFLKALLRKEAPGFVFLKDILTNLPATPFTTE